MYKNFNEICNSSGIVTFIWDQLNKLNWDQSILVRECSHCNQKSFRITYHFPRKVDQVTLSVLNIIGLIANNDGYMPMIWETQPLQYPDEKWIDFKYMNGRNSWGLNKPAVLDKENLRSLAELYKVHSGKTLF